MLNDRLVRSGPFIGMRYVRDSQGSVYLPKIVGVYEMEIWDVIEQLISDQFKQIYVVGAGEGYYAIGLALRCPGSVVYAFEANIGAHPLILEMAKENNCTNRIFIKGECDVAGLCDMLSDNPLLIMDVEGAEKILLNPSTNPKLLKGTIIFESHFSHEETDQFILRNFQDTHSISKFDTCARSWRDLSFLPKIYAFYIRRMLRFWFEEMRGGPMSWYLLKPRN